LHVGKGDWYTVRQQKLDLTVKKHFGTDHYQKWSVFALEHKQWKDVHFEFLLVQISKN
jgi:hypothetical protein